MTIQIYEGKANKHYTTSRVVAKALGKSHKRILEDCRLYLEEGTEFGLSSYVTKQTKVMTEYNVYKKGFILLVMNYQGYNDFKRAYVDKFEEMEEILKTQSNTKLSKQSAEKRTTLTNEWQGHGIEKGYHYINLTKQEYKSLFGNRDIKKENMTEEQKRILMAFEAVEAVKLMNNPTMDGYYTCRDSITETAGLLDIATRKVLT